MYKSNCENLTHIQIQKHVLKKVELCRSRIMCVELSGNDLYPLRQSGRAPMESALKARSARCPNHPIDGQPLSHIDDRPFPIMVHNEGGARVEHGRGHSRVGHRRGLGDLAELVHFGLFFLSFFVSSCQVRNKTHRSQAVNRTV